MSVSDGTAHVRYLVHDVQAAIDFYTTHLDFTLNTSAVPAFADVTRGNLRLLLSGPASSAGRPVERLRAVKLAG
jgi:catechol 2,3-dioxygenase-like lactoylglutathione lyase family enzyme